LVANFETLDRHEGGPRGFLRDLCTIQGPQAARERIEFVTGQLAYIQSKGARDLLTTGLRIADEYLAFDVRWQNVLKKVGVDVPAGTFASPAKYSEFEAVIMAQVARPLKITGKQLDQLVFNNYDAILKETWLST
jgi:hypothetical protein